MGSHSDDVDQLRIYNEERRRADANAQERREMRQQQQQELKDRLALQEKLMTGIRKPGGDQLGGLTGKFLHLGDLNQETLAGQVMAKVFFDICQLIFLVDYRADLKLFHDAERSGIAYDGTQVIYHVDENGKVDYDWPYFEGEDPSLMDIYANGYIPPATVLGSMRNWFGDVTAGYVGEQFLLDDFLVPMFGQNKADEIKKRHGGGGLKNRGDDVEDNLIANPPGPG